MERVAIAQIFPKESWNSRTEEGTEEVSIYIDASASSKRVGVVIFSGTLCIHKSYRIKEGRNVLQADIFTIKECNRLT